MMRWRFVLWLVMAAAVFLTGASPEADHFRITAAFTVKQKEGDKGQLVKGRLFYDVKVNKLCYQIHFPEPEYLVFKDSLLYRFSAEGVFLEKKEVVYHPTFSTYALVLNRNLDDLGLKQIGYTAAGLEMQGDSVAITLWEPPANLDDKLGKVYLSHKRKVINGSVIYGPKGDVVAKEFYQQVEVIEGMPVPVEKLTILYRDEGKQLTITKLSNVQFDELDHEDLYNFPLPD